MSTVLTVSGVRIVIYPNDHSPSHVHAIGRGGERAKYVLNCPDGPVELIEQRGFKVGTVIACGQAIAAQLHEICKQWSLFHG